MGNRVLVKKLYHYTSQNGLMGILKNSELWATKIFYMNDASEFNEPLKIAREILESKLHRRYAKNNKLEKNLIEDLYFETDIWEVLDNICIVSFCTKGDLLSQWRGYGHPGSAYSIGFDSEKLMENLKSMPFKLYPCEYFDSNEYKAKIDSFISDVIDQARTRQELPDAVSLSNEFTRMAATMKFRCFQEENEWRLVSSMVGDNELEFRAGKSMIIPYYPIRFDISSISEITIGPCKNQQLALWSVSQLVDKLFKKQKKRVEVKVSEIPYNLF